MFADLSEYAPNLRGSGVHGALMCLEPRFTADTLADLLHIASSKTLLRRHLVHHFDTLVGPFCKEHKRLIESSPHYQPLNINYKVVHLHSHTQSSHLLFSAHMQWGRKIIICVALYFQILPKLHFMELFPTPTFQDDVFAINYISIAFPMKQFSFKFSLRVIV